MIARFIFVLFLVFVGNSAFAAHYYDSKDSCEVAWRANKAVEYKPTAKHKKYGDARIAGVELRPLEGPACVLLGAQPGKRWVFLPQGTKVYTKGTKVLFLFECQNDIYNVVYLTKEEDLHPALPVASAPTPAPAASVPCMTDGCGNLTITDTVTRVTNVVDDCRYRSQSIPLTNGKCVVPTLEVVAPVRVTAPASCGNCGTASQGQPQRQAQAEQQETPVANLVQRVANKDGICGIVVVDPKDSRNVLARLMLQPYKGESGVPEKIGNLQILQVNEFKKGQVFRIHGEITGIKPSSCPAALDYVEKNWPRVVQKFSLPNDCKVARLEGANQDL